MEVPSFLNCQLLRQVVRWFEQATPVEVNNDENAPTPHWLTPEAVGFLLSQAPSFIHVEALIPFVQEYVQVVSP